INTMALPLLINLLEYGRKNSTITILEGILYSDYYEPLFRRAIEEYGPNIYAYYYDLAFEETVRRHGTKPNRFSFGEEDMRRWWREKDYIGIIPEKIITADVSLAEAVERIYRDVTEV
ncbi:MAG: uridine kinase, partial [Acetatifactor sp.]|nr:uridine kinase [Acetatifactor sp.]